ncbi:MAG TPA: aminotransferase class V-fold PLP-dependent enzyme [Candidatus Paceibacterota bacterium]|nr:aminotransferase class V-fold PLP-dependent enzyme [Candidatus Paceibacterota bacterium]
MWSAKRTYLDWAAAAPVSKNAERAFSAALKAFGNPSSPHEEGRRARAILEEARTGIARLAGTKPDAVVFTAGATEANALAVLGRIEALRVAGRSYESMHVLYLPSAHASIRGAVGMLRGRGVQLEEMSIRDGRMDLAKLKEQLRPETVLVSVDAVCGETGAMYKVRDVRRALDAFGKESGTNVTLHADASQAPFVESFELSHLGADLVSLDAQKIGAIRGIGCLIAPRRTVLTPLFTGGGQERGLRPGTESPALAAAFAESLSEAEAGREAFLTRATAMRAELIETIRGGVRGLAINEGKEQAPHILNMSLVGRDTDYLVALLDEAGFAVSTKSACETDSAEGSRAVRALTGDAARAESTLRISWGPGVPDAALKRFACAFIDAVRFLDAHAI